MLSSDPAIENPLRDHKAPLDPSLEHLETLTRRTAWVRALARKLVGDAHLAEDVAQDAEVVALEAGHPRQSWLRGVVRNLAANLRRQAGRRRQKEALAARVEGTLGAADSAALVEQQRLLAEAVLSLEEPYREVVLLRFYEELPQREIARRLGVPATTVNSRLGRALGNLRRHLDGRQGSRRAWVMALAKIGWPKGAPAPWLGSKALAGFAALFLVALPVAWVLLPDPVEEVPGLISSPLASEQAVAEGEGEGSGARRQGGGSREERPPTDTGRAPLPEPTVVVKLVDDRGQPLPGRTITFVEGAGDEADRDLRLALVASPDGSPHLDAFQRHLSSRVWAVTTDVGGEARVSLEPSVNYRWGYLGDVTMDMDPGGIRSASTHVSEPFQIEFPGEERTYTATIYLHTGVTGRVDTGDLVPVGPIHLWLMGRLSERSMTLRDLELPHTGRYVFEGLTPGLWRIKASWQGPDWCFYSDTVSVTAVSGALIEAPPFTFDDNPHGIGFVVEASGEVGSDIVYSLGASGPLRRGENQEYGVTAEDIVLGQPIEFRNMPAGNYSVHAHLHPRGEPSQEIGRLVMTRYDVPEDEGQHRIVIPVPHSFHAGIDVLLLEMGSLDDPERLDVRADAGVRLLDGRRVSKSDRRIVVRPRDGVWSGRLDLEGIHWKGPVLLVAGPGSLDAAELNAFGYAVCHVLDDGMTYSVNIRMQEGAILEGQVGDLIAPGADTLFLGWSPDIVGWEGQVDFAARVGPDGSFRICGLPPEAELRVLLPPPNRDDSYATFRTGPAGSTTRVEDR